MVLLRWEGRANLADGLRVSPAEREAISPVGSAMREAVRPYTASIRYGGWAAPLGRPKKTKL